MDQATRVTVVFFFFSSRRRHTRCSRDWSSDVCSSDLSSRASEFSIGAACHHLELFHRIQCNVDRSALPALLLTKESVVVVSAVQAHVIKDSTLAVEGDLVAVGPLRN